MASLAVPPGFQIIAENTHPCFPEWTEVEVLTTEKDPIKRVIKGTLCITKRLKLYEYALNCVGRRDMVLSFCLVLKGLFGSFGARRGFSGIRLGLVPLTVLWG